MTAARRREIEGTLRDLKSLLRPTYFEEACESAIRDLLAELRRREWQPIGELVQDGRPVLVWLSEPMLGSRVQTMRTGNVAAIGGLFAFDAPTPTHFRELPEPPDAD